MGVVLLHVDHELAVDAQHGAHLQLLLGEQRPTVGHDELGGRVDPLAERRRRFVPARDLCHGRQVAVQRRGIRQLADVAVNFGVVDEHEVRHNVQVHDVLQLRKESSPRDVDFLVDLVENIGTN